MYKLKIVDCHSHQFFYKNIDNIIKENKEKGVVYIVENGLNFETNKIVLELSKKYDIVLPAIGFHPTDIVKSDKDLVEKTIRQIEENIKNVVAIGEIGLDYYWIKDEESRKKEIDIFKKILEISEKNKKPVIIHSRGAEKEVIDILKSYKLKVVLHSFGGKKKYALEASDNGFYFSIPAIVYKSRHFQELVKILPIDLILTETDSPFLDPIDVRKNRSWKIIYGLEKISEILNVDIVELSNKIFKNFSNLFLNS